MYLMIKEEIEGQKKGFHFYKLLWRHLICRMLEAIQRKLLCNMEVQPIFHFFACKLLASGHSFVLTRMSHESDHNGHVSKRGPVLRMEPLLNVNLLKDRWNALAKPGPIFLF